MITETVITNNSVNVNIVSKQPTKKIVITITQGPLGNVIYKIQDTFDHQLSIDERHSIRLQDLINAAKSEKSGPFIVVQKNVSTTSFIGLLPYYGAIEITDSQLEDFSVALDYIYPELQKRGVVNLTTQE